MRLQNEDSRPQTAERRPVIQKIAFVIKLGEFVALRKYRPRSEIFLAPDGREKIRQHLQERWTSTSKGGGATKLNSPLHISIEWLAADSIYYYLRRLAFGDRSQIKKRVPVNFTDGSHTLQ